jgi:peptidoglycan hydrolase-like protein with peptidoglycan-binding domain
MGMLVAAVVAVSIPSPVSAASTLHQFPTQTLGDRGTDVQAIQLLLTDRDPSLAPDSAVAPGTRMQASPFPGTLHLTIDGVFGATTRDAVSAFQRSVGLAPNGRVGPATWLRLVRPLTVGDTGVAVQALQLELHRKRHTAIPADYGTFGRATLDAVKLLQGKMGLPVTGSVGTTTWRELAWHFELPVFGSSLCDYSTGNGAANWGTAALIGFLRSIAIAARSLHLGSMSLGDVSLETGGNILGHETHKVGLDMDILAIRHDRRACSGTNWRAATYDRAATLALIKLIRAGAPHHIKVIYFNDPVLIKAGYTVYKAGHDDHIHVRFCEAAHADPRYVCPSG